MTLLLQIPFRTSLLPFIKVAIICCLLLYFLQKIASVFRILRKTATNYFDFNTGNGELRCHGYHSNGNLYLQILPLEKLLALYHIKFMTAI